MKIDCLQEIDKDGVVVRVIVSTKEILQLREGEIFDRIVEKIAEPIAHFVKLEVLRRLDIPAMAAAVQDRLTKAAIEVAAKKIASEGL